MPINALFDRIFGKQEKTSRDVAKERLLFALQADRTTIPPVVMEQIREEIIAVFSKYLEVDVEDVDVNVERDGNATALVANIPIRRVRA